MKSKLLNLFILLHLSCMSFVSNAAFPIKNPALRAQSSIESTVINSGIIPIYSSNPHFSFLQKKNPLFYDKHFKPSEYHPDRYNLNLRTLILGLVCYGLGVLTILAFTNLSTIAVGVMLAMLTIGAGVCGIITYKKAKAQHQRLRGLGIAGVILCYYISIAAAVGTTFVVLLSSANKPI